MWLHVSLILVYLLSGSAIAGAWLGITKVSVTARSKYVLYLLLIICTWPYILVIAFFQAVFKRAKKQIDQAEVEEVQ